MIKHTQPFYHVNRQTVKSEVFGYDQKIKANSPVKKALLKAKETLFPHHHHEITLPKF